MTELTLEDVRSSFAYDPDTGALSWTKRRMGPKKSTDVAGCKNNAGYLVTCIKSKLYLNHRLIWFYVFGEWPRATIDHINGDRLDNSLANLRDVDRKTNNQNIHALSKRNSSGIRGVKRVGSSWSASITYGGKSHYLGTFKTASAKEKHHPGYVK